jgi:hypothetical protein
MRTRGMNRAAVDSEVATCKTSPHAFCSFARKSSVYYPKKESAAVPQISPVKTSRKRNSVVRFVPDSEILYIPVPSLSEMSKKQVAACWWSPDEFDELRIKYKSVVHLMEQSSPENREAIEGSRGLEQRTEEGAWKYFTVKRAAANAVFVEQNRQRRHRKHQRLNPVLEAVCTQSIAAAYTPETLTAVNEALRRAKHDAKEARKIRLRRNKPVHSEHTTREEQTACASPKKSKTRHVVSPPYASKVDNNLFQTRDMHDENSKSHEESPKSKCRHAVSPPYTNKVDNGMLRPSYTKDDNCRSHEESPKSSKTRDAVSPPNTSRVDNFALQLSHTKDENCRSHEESLRSSERTIRAEQTAYASPKKSKTRHVVSPPYTSKVDNGTLRPSHAKDENCRSHEGSPEKSKMRHVVSPPYTSKVDNFATNDENCRSLEESLHSLTTRRLRQHSMSSAVSLSESDLLEILKPESSRAQKSNAKAKQRTLTPTMEKASIHAKLQQSKSRIKIKRRNKVRFSDSVTTYPGHQMDCTDHLKSDIADRWLSATELQDIECRYGVVLGWMEQGIPVIEESSRGLEHRTNSAARELYERRRHALNVVLIWQEEQRKKKKNGRCADDEEVAFRYRAATKQERQEAYYNGEQDAIDAMRYHHLYPRPLYSVGMRMPHRVSLQR